MCLPLLLSPKAAQDLLAGISMSQLFTQPSPPRKPRFQQGPKKPPSKTTPAASGEEGSKPAQPSAQKRPITRWWERHTTTELELTGTVDDVINPSLLAAGRAEAGGKAMAVSSLRELWDEEKERSRVAGGGSQLSAPPGLELADSQDAWEPPEGLLTQDMKGAVEDLARNVIRRKPPPRDTGAEAGVMYRGGDRRSSQQYHSQTSAASVAYPAGGRGGVQSSPPKVAFTPPEPRKGLLPSTSPSVVRATGMERSASPVSNLLSRSPTGNENVNRNSNEEDQGLFDMLAALRGSSQDSRREDVDSQTSSPRGGRYTQSPTGALSQEALLSTPTSSADRAEAIAATQVRCHVAYFACYPIYALIKDRLVVMTLQTGGTHSIPYFYYCS